MLGTCSPLLFDRTLIPASSSEFSERSSTSRGATRPPPEDDERALHIADTP